jgi:hypothetical protein
MDEAKAENDDFKGNIKRCKRTERAANIRITRQIQGLESNCLKDVRKERLTITRIALPLAPRIN